MQSQSLQSEPKLVTAIKIFFLSKPPVMEFRLAIAFLTLANITLFTTDYEYVAFIVSICSLLILISLAVRSLISASKFTVAENESSHEVQNSLHAGFKYVVYTLDGVKLGDLDEVVYLRAKQVVESCARTRKLQCLNSIKVIFATLGQAILVAPATLLIIGIFNHFMTTGITAGNFNLPISINLNDLTLAFVAGIMLVAIRSYSGRVHECRGLRNFFGGFPCYKNFFTLKLKQILAKELPNIANAKQFKILREPLTK